MNTKLLIVQNISREGPGILADLLAEHGIESECCDLSQGETAPDPAGFVGMVVLGSPQSANDATPQITGELALIEKALDADVPYLGICLDFQLLVKAAGGSVVKCAQKEIGFRDLDGKPFMVDLTGDGKRDALFCGMVKPLRVFQLHGETVELTDGMTLLATGHGCPNQVVRIGGNAWGLQCHFEMTPAMFNIWIGIDADLKALNRTELLTEFEAISTEYAETGRSIMRNFLVATGLVKA